MHDQQLNAMKVVMVPVDFVPLLCNSWHMDDLRGSAHFLGKKIL